MNFGLLFGEMMKLFLMPLILLFCVSCIPMDKDLAHVYSYEDPFYLGINDLLASCTGASVVHRENWIEEYNHFLSKYRQGNHKINFNAVELPQMTCSLLAPFKNVELVEFKDHWGRDSKSMLVNIYHIMIIDLVSKNYSQVLVSGVPDLPENRSLLNIFNKGLSIFKEVKWPLFNRYLSLDQIEAMISQEGGEKIEMLLFRGMKGFAPIPENALTFQSLEDYSRTYLQELVNEEIFYDDADNNFIAYAPGNLSFFSSNEVGEDLNVRNLILKHLNIDQWGSVLNPEHILQKDSFGSYLWKIEYNPVNWQLAE